MNASANVTAINQEPDALHDQAVFSLERLVERNMGVAVETVKIGEPSELAKELQDMVIQVAVVIALRETQVEKIDKESKLPYMGWNELRAANALGITHKQLRAKIKQFGLVEPKPNDGQGDMFGEAA